MKKKNIVKKKQEFNRIIKKRQGKATECFIINKDKNEDNVPKFGITFTKHIGRAVDRNKLKRRIKSVIDNNDNIYNNNYDYIIIARPKTISLSYKELENELIQIFLKIKE